MTPELASRAVIDMVPNWYEAETGKVHYDLEAGGRTVHFWGHRDPTPHLSEFLRRARAELTRVSEELSRFSSAVGVDLLQEHFAHAWLDIVAPEISWRKLIDFSRSCLLRTYENDEVCFNLIVRDGEGKTCIAEPELQKVFDPLASSSRTYLEVDRSFRLVNFREISWNQISDEFEYTFHPEFLRPFVSVLYPDSYSVHQTRRGDLIIMNHEGLLAAKRKGRWKVYDVYTLKNSITEAVEDYRVGANLFEVVFDLSFRRHGALLVFDPRRLVLPNVSNPGSRFDPDLSDLPRTVLRDPVEGIGIGATDRAERKKLLLLELASVDGAVIFDRDHVLACGAMIRAHEDATGQVGARSTAARSAYLYGGRPIKVSSDGEISILFRSTDEEGGSADARLEFL